MDLLQTEVGEIDSGLDMEIEKALAEQGLKIKKEIKKRLTKFPRNDIF